MNRKEAVNARVAERENLMQMIYQMGITGDFSQEAYDGYINTEISWEIQPSQRTEMRGVLSGIIPLMKKTA